MLKIIKSVDELIKECGHFYCATVNENINNGHNCNHENQEEYEIINGEKIGKCSSFSCPIAHVADMEDFENPNIDNNGWNEFEDLTFLVVEQIKS